MVGLVDVVYELSISINKFPHKKQLLGIKTQHRPVIIPKHFLLHALDPLYMSQIKVDDQKWDRHVDKLQEIQKSHLENGLTRNVLESHPFRCVEDHSLEKIVYG